VRIDLAGVDLTPAHTVTTPVKAAYRRGDLLDKWRELMEAWAGFCEIES